MNRVLVTAGASGIGYAMAQRFDASDWDVWVTDIDADALANCPQHWTKRQLDVADEGAMATCFADVEAKGGLQALCANAGVAGPTAAIANVDLADWQSCVSVNLEGAFLATKYAGPMMQSEGQGAIVYTTSTAGQYGYPNRAPYAAAKWAVIGLMKTAAMELGPNGVRCNAIAPGAVEGPRMQGVLAREAAAKGTTPEVIYQGYAAGTAMQTWVEARDIAEMAYFLSSDAARYVSGQVIAVDGHTVNPDPKG